MRLQKIQVSSPDKNYINERSMWPDIHVISVLNQLEGKQLILKRNDLGHLSKKGLLKVMDFNFVS